jgi:hypothetical protein
MMRRKVHVAQHDHIVSKERDRGANPYAVDNKSGGQASQKRRTDSRFSAVPVVTSDDPAFHASLKLSIQSQIGQPPFSRKSRDWQRFAGANGEKTTTIASVCVMLSLSKDFRCALGTHCANGRQFTFFAWCAKCGRDFSIKIRCPRSMMNLSVATRKCCGHFSLHRSPLLTEGCQLSS